MLSYGVSRVSKNPKNLYLSVFEEFSSSTRLEERLERFLRPKSVNFWLEFSFFETVFQKHNFQIQLQYLLYFAHIWLSYSKMVHDYL